jgi:hypothetical protein
MLACVLLIATFQVTPASGGMDAMPTRIDLTRFTCGDLLRLQADRQELALVYLTGVADGRRRASAFDAELAGKAIERLLASCKATPSLVLMDAFIAAWP